MPPFETTEYQARLARTKASMSARGIDLLLAADPANMNYLTGYDGWSFYTPQVVAVSLDHDAPLCIVRGIDRNGANVTTWLPKDHNVGYPDNYVQSTERHPMDFMADHLKERGFVKDGQTVGVEMDAYYYSAACHAALVKGLPNCRFEDATNLVNWVRIIKSDTEIKYMHEAARLTEKVMATGIEHVRPGVRQCDAVAAIYQAQVAGSPDYSGDYTGLCPMLPTGVGTSTPHLTWTEAPFKVGEGTILELGAARHHYHVPMARTVFLGEPPQKIADTAKVVVEGLAAALEAAKPGALAHEVEDAWRKTAAKGGVVKESRIGYSTGCNYPPDWGEHTLSLRPGDMTMLQPNMTIHCIPGVWMDDWGIEISECFHVTDKGAVPFADVPRDLVVKA